jgi:pimeloyl-ACP methyl ester carboxylesterase
MALPEHGLWPHPYYETPGERLEVSFLDAQGHHRRVATHHKVTGSGSPLVLVHGLMTSSYSWRYVMGDLANHYRVFIPDLVGAGSAEKPGDLVYSVDNVSRFVAAYIGALNVEPPYLVGNSLGGLHCLKALLDSPGLARRFVLMHAPGYPFARMRRFHELVRLPGVEWVLAWLLHRFGDGMVARSIHYERDGMLSQEEVREYGALFRTREGARVFARMLRESLDPSEYAAIIEGLTDDLSCPVLVLYAERDRLVPPDFGTRYARDIAGASLRWMKESSHFLQVDQPARTVAEILSFDGAS